jgi:hypothetical protein
MLTKLICAAEISSIRLQIKLLLSVRVRRHERNSGSPYFRLLQENMREEEEKTSLETMRATASVVLAVWSSAVQKKSVFPVTIGFAHR